MRRPAIAIAFAALAALAACASTFSVPSSAAALMAEAPEGQPARLLLAEDRIVAAAVPLGPGSLPGPVRSAIAAVAPHGETVFRGREWGPRGEGHRIEKRYLVDGTDHVRTALIADDGRVLERAHSVPIGEVPQDVLVAALEIGPDVTLALIVSGPDHEEYWQCTVRNRIGRTYSVRIDLRGRLVEVRRRVVARIDV